MAVIDLSQLPAPQIVDVPDFETLLAERKAAFLALYPKDEQAAVARTLTLESEPITNSCRKVPTAKSCCASVLMRPRRRSWWRMPSVAISISWQPTTT